MLIGGDGAGVTWDQWVDIAQIATALFTLVIAMVAVVVATREAKATRKHNELSVQPRIGFNKDKHGCIKLINSGIGPGIVSSVALKVGERWIEFVDNREEVDKYSTSLGRDFGVSHITRTLMLSADSDYALIHPHNEDAQGLPRAFEPSAIRFRYTDLYGNEQRKEFEF
jgi:hypothetical protein